MGFDPGPDPSVPLDRMQAGGETTRGGQAPKAETMVRGRDLLFTGACQ